MFLNEICGNPLGAVPLDTNLDGIHPSITNSSDDEFVEVVNGSGEFVNLSGWYLSDGSSVRHVFATGTFLEPGAAIVVFGGGDLASFSNQVGSAVVASSGSLDIADVGEMVFLSDASGALVDGHQTSSTLSGQSETRDPELTNGPFAGQASVFPGVLHSSGRYNHDRFAYVRASNGSIPCAPTGTLSQDLPKPKVIRNLVPIRWAGAAVNWTGDQNPANGVDDQIDSSPSSQRHDVLVNFRCCVQTEQIGLITNTSPSANIQMVCKYITVVGVTGISGAEAVQLAQDPDVAFIERQRTLSFSLGTSVQSIRVSASASSSPNTIEDQFPAIDGSGVNIVIMDSGVDNEHEAFSSTPYVAGYDALTQTFIDPDDDVGHGTSVASVALGRWPSGLRGVAPGAGLIDVRIGSAANPPSVAFVMDALETVYEKREDWNVGVINMSFGDTSSSNGLDALSQLVNLAEGMGICAVAAAGNDGPFNIGLGSPAAATNAITVASSFDFGTAFRGDDVPALDSSIGPRADDDTTPGLELAELKPEVTAPGQFIEMARFNTLTGLLTGSGTSFAAPHVAGLCALVKQAKGEIEAGAIKALIIETAEPMAGLPASLPAVDPVWNRTAGWGLIDGHAALTAQGVDISFPSHPPTPRWRSPDLTTTPFPPIAQQTTVVTAMVENRGSSTAFGVHVKFGVNVFSGANPTFFTIGEKIVDLPVGVTPVTCDWIPDDPSHQCLKVDICYGCDPELGNNSAQRNVRVAMSPVEFEIRNTRTIGPATVELDVTCESGNSTGWAVAMTPPVITLSGEDCPKTMRVLAIPPGNAPVGEGIIVDIATRVGGVLVGGVSVIATKDAGPYPGNGSDAEISVAINGVPDPSFSQMHVVGANDLVTLGFSSPLGSLIGQPFIAVAQVVTSLPSPLSLSGDPIPTLLLDPTMPWVTLVNGFLTQGQLFSPVLGGYQHSMLIPASLVGLGHSVVINLATLDGTVANSARIGIAPPHELVLQ